MPVRVCSLCTCTRVCTLIAGHSCVYNSVRVPATREPFNQQISYSALRPNYRPDPDQLWPAFSLITSPARTPGRRTRAEARPCRSPPDTLMSTAVSGHNEIWKGRIHTVTKRIYGDAGKDKVNYKPPEEMLSVVMATYFANFFIEMPHNRE